MTGRRPRRPTAGRVKPGRGAAGRGGFTLVELLVAVTLLALAAGAAALSVRHPIAAARAALAADRIAGADAAARTLAVRRGRPVRLTFDLDAGTLARGGGAGGAPVTLATGTRVAEFRRAGTTATRGATEVSIGADGGSPTYAVQLAGGEGWLLFAGGTGAPVRVDDVETIAALLAVEAR